MEKDSWRSRLNGTTNAVIGCKENTELFRAGQTTSCEVVPQWGNRKRLRCMKILVKDDPSGSVQRSSLRLERKVVRSEKDASNQQPSTASGNNTNANGGYFNLRQRLHPLHPPACQRTLRNSETSGAMRGQTNGGAHDNRSAHCYKNNNHDNNANHNNKSDGSSPEKAATHDSKKGGGFSSSAGSGETAVPAVWPPKFVIGLTNKEKEEDFWVLKGSKLPQRPKKRAKFIQKTLNLVSPGTWLCDLTLERYEVREKKVSKKRPRGLKAMSNMESESE